MIRLFKFWVPYEKDKTPMKNISSLDLNADGDKFLPDEIFDHLSLGAIESPESLAESSKSLVRQKEMDEIDFLQAHTTPLIISVDIADSERQIQPFFKINELLRLGDNEHTITQVICSHTENNVDVYKIKPSGLNAVNAPLAVKLFKPDFQHSRTSFEFIREIDIYKLLNKSKYIKCFPIFVEKMSGNQKQPYDNHIYVCCTTSYIDGATLQKTLSAPNIDYIDLFNKIINAVYCLHLLDIVHFDLHAGNLIIEKDTQNVRIIDFGRACKLTDKNHRSSINDMLERFYGNVHVTTDERFIQCAFHIDFLMVFYTYIGFPKEKGFERHFLNPCFPRIIKNQKTLDFISGLHDRYTNALNKKYDPMDIIKTIFNL